MLIPTSRHTTILKKKLKPGNATMTTSEYRNGDIFQINPEIDQDLGSQFIVATEIKDWGVQGYLLLDRPDTGRLIRWKGKAFIRKKWEEIFLVGHAEWMDKEDVENEE